MWELSFNAIYSSPWMEVIAAQSPSRNASHDIQKFPEVRGALEKAGEGGYPEAIVRLLVLLAKARGSVRRDRLERSNRILHSRPPFDMMTPEMRAHIINEQSLIVQFAPEEALQALPRLLRDDVDRVRAVNLVLDIAGPVTDMDAATIDMFKKIQSVLLTMARDWHEPPDAPQTQKPTTDTANGKVSALQASPTDLKGQLNGAHVEHSWAVTNLHEKLAKQKWFAPFAQLHWWR
jgi:tellurite resistance protein